ncbi:(2Fe-2S)-binding protein [Bacillus xiapuensis]|uniref:(2Fe-2S)-binding protein n=1 Tax=Bacillus xiapuensis TaxID=2014075 RepID=A0ABU6N9W0_9BACI|nr:(2Fe-2S)-binding protein [Bacillus xiapuensis]
MEKQKTVVCRCEEVFLEDLVETLQAHGCSSRELKLRTRAGMGYCGGRTCRNLIDKIVGKHMKKDRPNEIPLGYQPPVRPIQFFMMGNDSYGKK